MSTAGVIIKLVSTFGEDGSSLKQVKESVFCSKKRKSLVPRMELKLEKEVETIGSESSRTVEAGLYSSCYELPSITFSFDLNYANLPLIHLEFEELELDRRELDKQEGLQLHLRTPRWVLRAIEPWYVDHPLEVGEEVVDFQKGRKAHLLEDKQIPNVEVFDEVTRMTFRGKHVTWAHLEKKRTRLRLYTKSLEEYAYSAWRRRLVLIDPARVEYTYAIRLNFQSTNNEAEYEALLAGLRIAQKMKVHAWKNKANEHVALFKKFSIENIPRNQNRKADILSKLASVSFNHLTKEVMVEVLNEKFVDAQEVNTIVEEEEDNWITPIIKCLEEGIWPTDENEARSLRMKISQYVIEEGVLFKKSYLALMFRCVGPLQANYIIREVHEGACGMHAESRSVVVMIMRQGYYWPTMYRDAKKEIEKFGLPRVIVTDNGTQLVNDPFKSWCESLKAILGRERAGWVGELPNVLWAHRTMLKTSNGETLFSLTYGSEAVIPTEIGMPTYQITQFNEISNEEEMQLNLDLTQERRETTVIREAKYKKKVEQYYNK
ncbi:reverse transcriptase domain-containing protein [Tanacetum coccineum]